MSTHKPILCLDFDGVIHSYESGWKGAEVIPDPPVPGTKDFLFAASELFEIHIFSSRSNQEGGIEAMRRYVSELVAPKNQDMSQKDHELLTSLQWPTEKPPAFLTIDDRAVQFTGTWPNPEQLLKFQPWNKRSI